MPMLHTDGVDDVVVFSIGSLGFAFGPGTIVWIGRKGDDAGTETVFQAGQSGTTGRWGLEFSGSLPRLRCGASVVSAPAPMAVTAADDLVCLAVTKATGGVAPIFYRYDFSTAVWTSEVASSTLTNSGTALTSARIGATHTPSQWLNGDTGIVGASNTVLSEATIHTLVTELAAWSAAGLVAVWPCDQAATTDPIQDIIGGADETSRTGTTITADDIPWTNDAVTQRHKTRLLGTFETDKPVKLKAGGVWTERPVKVKSGGVFI